MVAQGRNRALPEGGLQDVDEARIGERRIDRRAIEEAHGSCPLPI